LFAKDKNFFGKNKRFLLTEPVESIFFLPMNPNSTYIHVLLDASGSMATCIEGTIAGFNKFVEDQKAVPGAATLALTSFNTERTSIVRETALVNVPKLSLENYKLGGNTALIDAMVETIKDAGKSLAMRPEQYRPGKVIFVVITDGEENASRNHTAQELRYAVKHQEDVYNWNFLYLGANQDAFKVGARFGFGVANSANYSSSNAGTLDMMGAVTQSMTAYRCSADPQFKAEIKKNAAGFVTNS
jgi:uncharacterized protein YegL